MERKEITKIVLVALFAALIAAGAFIKIPLVIAAGAFIKIPLVPVPVTLTTLFVLLAALCLPPFMALSSIVVYLFLGGIGLPIFTSGGGLAAMLGPTGGYLFGMIPAALLGSLIMRLFESKSRIGAVISSIVSTVFIYLVGLPWLALQMDLSAGAVLAAGFVPFIVGDVLKIIVASITAPVIRPRIKELLERE